MLASVRSAMSIVSLDKIYDDKIFSVGILAQVRNLGFVLGVVTQLLLKSVIWNCWRVLVRPTNAINYFVAFCSGFFGLAFFRDHG